jgi:hypothetical protein
VSTNSGEPHTLSPPHPLPGEVEVMRGRRGLAGLTHEREVREVRQRAASPDQTVSTVLQLGALPLQKG